MLLSAGCTVCTMQDLISKPAALFQISAVRPLSFLDRFYTFAYRTMHTQLLHPCCKLCAQ